MTDERSLSTVRRSLAGAVLLTFPVLVACTSDLRVFDKDGEPMVGYPLPVTEPYALERVFTALGSGTGDCDQTQASPLFVSLRTGDYNYVTVDTGPLSDSEFALSFNDDGVLRALTLNSASNVPEVISSTSELVTAVGSLAPTGGAFREGAAACDAAPKIVRARRLQDYLANPGLPWP